MQAPPHFDVLIVGAGLSGIGAAHHLQTLCPGKTYAILEGRERLGGTWDLFRYPGIRSDSDMYTLGYSFRPWTNPKAIADGPAILEYVRDTARQGGIDRHIRFEHRVVQARWSSETSRWTVEATTPAGMRSFTCGFLFMCAGYYDYDEGYTPDFPGIAQFRGRVVHPQKWTSDVDYEGKRVVVIGSGATAVTLVPELAKRAAHVTMLQRSPTYVVSAPAQDPVANWLRAKLPLRAAYATTRAKNVLMSIGLYAFSRRYPERTKSLIVGEVKKHLRDKSELAAHFTPTYKPWDQRVCLVPDADLFKAVRSGRASVVTDHVASFTERGITLRSGATLDADLVVTATGLKLKFLGGMKIEVDGERFEPSSTMTYKGMMCSGVPNLALAIGYTNASWTLKCDLTCEYVCRLLKHMDAHGYRECRPVQDDPRVMPEPLFDFSSGYVQRSLELFPRQGSRAPWKLYQNYAFDLAALRLGKLEDGAMRFT